MKNIGLLYAFLGGAVVGCATALLFAPEKGSDLRARIVAMLNKKGVKISDAEIDQLVAELSCSIEQFLPRSNTHTIRECSFLKWRNAPLSTI